MNIHSVRQLTIAALVGLLTLPMMNSTGWAGGIVTGDPTLPPDGDYVSPHEFHEYSAAGIILDNPIHRPLKDTATRTPSGADEIEEFDSVFDATVVGLGPMQLTGPVTVIARNKVGHETGTFETEIVSMSLQGITPSGLVQIREDPSRASTGSTDIIDIGGGLYHIDSFFDVYTELSLDGGNSWVASDSSTHMFLVPEPNTVTLLVTVGLLACPWRRERST